MYKVVKDIPKLIITLNIAYMPEPNEVAASTVNHPTSIKKENRLDDEKLLKLNDIVDTAVSFIRSHGFKIKNIRQSKKSYTVYVQFYPKSASNKLLDPVEVIFRIADHTSNTFDNTRINRSHRIYIMSLLVGEEEYKDIRAFTHEIDVICDQLASGDYSAFFV